MKIYKILGSLTWICIAIAITSCAEDKVYYLDSEGTHNGKVEFSAVNLAVPYNDDWAESSIDSDYNDFESRHQEFQISAMDPYYGGMGDPYVYYDINLSKVSEIWSGGYNDIEITFYPSTQHEKSATFTMPDGSSYTATADNPTFIWTPDSTMKNSTSPYIIAESHYTINNANISNIGYIYVIFNEEVRYIKDNSTWYQYPWVNGEKLEFPTYLSFSAENLTIGSPDIGYSKNDSFIWSIGSEKHSKTIPYIDQYGNNSRYEAYWNENQIFICGNNNIKFTYPDYGEDTNMYLTLPQSETVVLNKENPTYIWHISRELADNLFSSTLYKDKVISGFLSYHRNGINYNAYGEIELDINPFLFYDEEQDVFRYEE
ncbi:MAG: hypothetical protein K2J46_05330 [Muribaculaceae bacterium]|nr:hypothetical protein [Muribaculaceae bacterium]